MVVEVVVLVRMAVVVAVDAVDSPTFDPWRTKTTRNTNPIMIC